VLVSLWIPAESSLVEESHEYLLECGASFSRHRNSGLSTVVASDCGDDDMGSSTRAAEEVAPAQSGQLEVGFESRIIETGSLCSIIDLVATATAEWTALGGVQATKIHNGLRARGSSERKAGLNDEERSKQEEEQRHVVVARISVSESRGPAVSATRFRCMSDVYQNKRVSCVEGQVAVVDRVQSGGRRPV
jgi:hypothetical protein